MAAPDAPQPGAPFRSVMRIDRYLVVLGAGQSLGCRESPQTSCLMPTTGEPEMSAMTDTPASITAPGGVETRLRSLEFDDVRLLATAVRAF